MRTVALAALLAFGLAAAPASATIIDFRMHFNGPQAGVPESPGTGFGTATLDTDTNLFSWSISFQDLLGLTALAHFHKGVIGDNDGAIQLDTAIPTLVTAGSLSGSATLTDAQEADLLAELWYHNIHTLFDLTGEIRAQVLLAPAPALALGAALAAAIALRRRR
jgi:hypothetical protein